MSCFYCWQEGISTEEKGSCGYAGCTLEICTPPSGRFDGDFHGEVCGCGCGALVCERHLRDHAAQAHGRDDPGGCFPALWARVSGAGLGGASALLAGRGGEPNACNRFLNAVVPRDSLLRLAGGLSSALATVEQIPGGAYVRFAREFYVPATAQRTAALAVRELEHAAAGMALHPERAEWVRRATRQRGAVGRVGEAVERMLRRSGIVRPRDEVEPSSRGAAGIVMGQVRITRRIADAVDRHREVRDLHPSELAAWIAAPHTQEMDSSVGIATANA
ncbi:hypothetical protein [Longimicrobium sp.]|uniref:hypothetical protein n=1 Tax=Longimicrobium sp. TaxID=2029185 RepID=UPI002B9D78C5|nr:hypothetical protein [Longimicrobium sp.]HSU16662.1 hypothetical protein [Longimicrobium sp.]